MKYYVLLDFTTLQANIGFTNQQKWTVNNCMLHPWLLHMSAHMKTSLIFCAMRNDEYTYIHSYIYMYMDL